jgi:hypothetical protein
VMRLLAIFAFALSLISYFLGLLETDLIEKIRSYSAATYMVGMAIFALMGDR